MKGYTRLYFSVSSASQTIGGAALESKTYEHEIQMSIVSNSIFEIAN